MDERESLIDDLRKLPGVGPRQAERILSFLLDANKEWTRAFLGRIGDLRERVRVCTDCNLRFFPSQNEHLCPLCADTSRTGTTLVVVEKEADLRAIESSGAYRGRYFLLGRGPSLPERDSGEHAGTERLLARLRALKEAGTLTEITLALSLTPDGEDTALFLREKITKDPTLRDIRIASLGRGLSTGSELEYADTETIKNAFLGKR